MSDAPRIRGWCPGAWRPMMSGDGLVVRIRPLRNRLSRDQVSALASLAVRYGNGIIDLTSRANLQIRGVSPGQHDELLRHLAIAGLLDVDAETEARRNILCSPFWQADDRTVRLHDALLARITEMPELPAKMGIAVDTGADPLLAENPADFRFENDAEGSLILRADGAATGSRISETDAPDALLEMAHWFVRSGGPEAGRMKRHLRAVALPEQFTGTAPAPAVPTPPPGRHREGMLLGAAFGALEARALLELMGRADVAGIRTTPWRMFLAETHQPFDTALFISTPGDPALRISACPGAPSCDQAQAPTRPLARHLATLVAAGQSLHVSGCSKGCAHRNDADITVVGNAGAFDLVRNGTAWDEPLRRTLSGEDIAKEVAQRNAL